MMKGTGSETKDSKTTTQPTSSDVHNLDWNEMSMLLI